MPPFTYSPFHTFTLCKDIPADPKRSEQLARVFRPVGSEVPKRRWGWRVERGGAGDGPFVVVDRALRRVLGFPITPRRAAELAAEGCVGKQAAQGQTKRMRFVEDVDGDSNCGGVWIACEIVGRLLAMPRARDRATARAVAVQDR